LLQRVRQVRRKWQTERLVKGISLFLAAAIAALVFGVWGADLFGFTPPAVWAARIVTAAAVLFVAWQFLWVPLRRRISDVQIAQYVEERYPHLEDRLVTAVEFGDGRGISPGMLDLLIKDALDKTSRVDLSVFVNRRRVATYGAVGGAALAALVALLQWGPSFFPYGFGRLYVPWTAASDHAVFLIQVAPGSVEVAKGTDQQVRAQLVGFDSPDVRLFTQPENGAAWTSFAMEPEPRGSGFLYLLIDLQASSRYYVEAKGVRSQTYALKVVDLPKVDRIDLTYRFPEYSGMAPQTVEGEGDISALKGTEVDLKVHLSQGARGARLMFDDKSTLDLVQGPGNLFTGTLKLKRSGSYVVELAASSGRRYNGSSEYQVEAIEDAPPKVTITKPMRDLRATNVEEVFSEVKAEDDIGVAKVELRYSVNGGDEKSIPLFPGGAKAAAQPSVTGTHTFFLEEFGLQPGDVISYYGRASDNNSVSGAGTSSSDIYFIEVRPFEQKYTQSQAGQMPGGGGESGAENLSRQQKEIISATFKLIRDKDKMDAKEWVDSVKSLSLVQSRLQTTTQGLVDRLARRGAAEANANFGKLADYLKEAIVEMEKAAVLLGEQKPKDALPDEQKALQKLMRAESLFKEIQVSFGNQGGAGSGTQANAEDLADLFELELNKLKNQYETVQRGEQQARDQRLDEALQRLKELAQRQQQLNERNRMLGQRGGSSASSGGGGGQSQQQLLDEAEKLQRQLQRLSRERSSPELNRVSSQLQQAIQQMKEAAARGQRGNSQEAAAQGIRALQQLEEARSALARGQESGLKQGVEQAADESKQLLDEQKRIQEGIDRLAQDKQQAGADAAGRRRELVERKGVLADRLKNLGTKLDDLSRQARKTQRETSTKLSDASGIIRDKKLPERVMQGNQLLESGYYDFIKGREEFIRGNLEELARQLESARGSLGQSREGKLEDAVNRSRQLAEGLESMQQRMRNLQQQRGRGGQKGQQAGQQGQQPGQGQQAGQQGQAQGQGQGQQGGGQPGQPGQQGGQQGQQAGNPQASGGGPGQQNAQNPAGGRPSGDVAGLTGNSSGPPLGTGVYSDENYRQLRREVQQRLTDAAELRRLMDRNPTQTRNLEAVIETLRRLDGPRNYSDPEEIARLKAAIEKMRQLELDLSRDLARLTQKDKYFYSDDNEAPSSYRRLVDEYYKALARGKP
jgi:hypothetical protein